MLAPRTRRASRPDVLFTGLGPSSVLPGWAQPYAKKKTTARQVRSLAHLSPLTVVQLTAPVGPGEQGTFLSLLAARQRNTALPSKIVFVFDADETMPRADELLEVLSYFERADDVEFALGPEQGAFALEEAIAKMTKRARDLERESEPPATQDPLGEVQAILHATSDLRGTSGRLSARRVAEVFGLALAELAAVLGRSRQSVAKTEDAPSLQAELQPFERVARLRSVLPAVDFHRWLHLPSPALAGQTPLELIRARQAPVVADLVADMLSGSPA